MYSAAFSGPGKRGGVGGPENTCVRTIWKAMKPEAIENQMFMEIYLTIYSAIAIYKVNKKGEPQLVTRLYNVIFFQGIFYSPFFWKKIFPISLPGLFRPG